MTSQGLKFKAQNTELRISLGGKKILKKEIRHPSLL